MEKGKIDTRLYRSYNYGEILVLPKIYKRNKEMIFYIKRQSFLYSSLIKSQKYFGIKFYKLDIDNKDGLKSIIMINNYCDCNGKLLLSEIPIRLDMFLEEELKQKINLR